GSTSWCRHPPRSSPFPAAAPYCGASPWFGTAFPARSSWHDRAPAWPGRKCPLLEAVDGRLGKQWRGAGRDIRAQPDLHAVADQFIKVRALQGVAAREDHQRIPERFDLVEQFETLRGIELLRMPARLGGCAAVHACQVARLGYFPNHEHG